MCVCFALIRFSSDLSFDCLLCFGVLPSTALHCFFHCFCIRQWGTQAAAAEDSVADSSLLLCSAGQHSSSSFPLHSSQFNFFLLLTSTSYSSVAAFLLAGWSCHSLTSPDASTWPLTFFPSPSLPMWAVFFSVAILAMQFRQPQQQQPLPFSCSSALHRNYSNLAGKLWLSLFWIANYRTEFIMHTAAVRCFNSAPLMAYFLLWPILQASLASAPRPFA